MRIGIDCRQIAETAGIGEYVRQSVKHLIQNNKQDMFVLFFADRKIAENFQQENTETVVLPMFEYKKYLPIIYSQIIAPLFMGRYKLDVCWFPANIIPLFYRGQAVVTIHDLAVYKFPELFPDKLIDFDCRILVPSSLRRANRIIAVSSSTKNDIIELFGIQAEKISVVYEGGDFGFDGTTDCQLPADLKLKKYFLFVGTIEPRKNLLKLIEAYTKLVQSGVDDYDLVLAGKSGWKNEAIFQKIKTANQELGAERIKCLGFVSNEQKALLYQQAFALVLLSIYEGFGLPAAEALQFGLPMVLADNSALPEIGGQAAIYAKEDSAEEIFQRLTEMCVNQSLYDQLVSEARCRAPQFTWTACAKGVLEALKSVK